ncbi:MAG: hypothetical protein PWP23_231 [Candidatus Sumerlaeota bacterium]|nr:hypothetical protein [Candidatus Sumerlaeota bacterium]
MFRNVHRQVALLLLLLLGAVSAVGQDDGRASEPSEEQVEQWIAALRGFRPPEPGPISSETARRQREILRAPLEQMPPPVRAGYILSQLGIFHCNGDWEGFTALRRRVTNPESWTYAPEDNLPLRYIAAYYDNKIFPPPGGPPSGSPEQSSSRSMWHWDTHYRSQDEYLAVLEYTYDHAEHTDGMAARMGYLLAHELERLGRKEQADTILGELNAIPLDDFTATSFYDGWGRLQEVEQLRKENADFIDTHRNLNSGEMDRRIEEAARAQRADLERRREQGEEIPVESDPLAFPNSPTTSVRPSGYPVPTAVQDQTSTEPVTESPGGAGGRTRLWLLLGGVLAAAAVGGGLLAWRWRRGAAAG